MKGNRPNPPASGAAAPLSPTSKTAAKYTNKDGSKSIVAPKANVAPVEPAQPSPTTAPSSTANATPAASSTGADPPPQPVNRKKQKRRAKAAAKAAAAEQQAQQSATTNGVSSPPQTHDQQPAGQEPEEEGQGDAPAQPEPQDQPSEQQQQQQNSASAATGKSKKSKKKKKKQKDGQGAGGDGSRNQSNRSGMSREKIWNTDSQEERERIKEFWLGLSEAERKSLVKVEKDAVLKKMKEQQKHTCSCTVCGRKRTAIEEELEGLYDAYYEELEQYANHPNQGEGPPMLRPRRSFGSTGGMRPRGLHSRFSNHQPSRGRILDDAGDDGDGVGGEEDEEGEEDGDDIYSAGELEDDIYSEDEHEPSEELHRSDYAAEFFNFGNSLTVQGGILTVADDLLKNDGKRFIEMMEQLAERRMAREEDARSQFARGYDHANGDRYHSHPPPPDDEEYDEEEDDYVDEEDEEDYDSQDEEDTMTDEQRMEEGRRMFQIFAARMFEQRVLTAYREKVAKERQAKLLEEIEAENQQDAQRKAKKAKEAQKRKDRAARKKEALAEEKARKEAEKAAEEAARKAEEERKAEEARQRAEEKRKKKEAQRKAEEEERQRKEAERLRKIQEREEAERKAREAKEREKKAREQREKEARERKEREAREKKEQQEREKREQQERERREKEAKAKAEREAKEAKAVNQAKETKAAAAPKDKKQEDKAPKAVPPPAPVPVPTPVPKRAAPQQPTTPAVPVPPVAPVPALPQQIPKNLASPQIPVATPALPKAPTPIRPRQVSQNEGSTVPSAAASNAGSRGSQNPSPHPVTPVHASPGPIAPPSKSGAASASGTGGPGLQPTDTLSYSASPTTFPAKPIPPPTGAFGLPPPGPTPPFPPGLHSVPPGFGAPLHREPGFPPMGGGFRTPHSMSIPPGFGPPGVGRGFPLQPPPGLFNTGEPPAPGIGPILGSGLPKDGPPSHSRQGSTSLDSPAAQPISRPTPIGRPASVVPGQRASSGSPSSGLPKPEPDTHLGSRALLDDPDGALPDFPSGRTNRVGSLPGTRPAPGFGLGPYGLMDSLHPHNPWAPGSLPPANSFPPPPPGFAPNPLGMPGPMHVPWGPPMSHLTTFGSPGVVGGPIEPRAVALRKMLRRACEELSADAAAIAPGAKPTEQQQQQQPGITTPGATAFIPLERIKAQVDIFNGYPVDLKVLLDICETEGNEVNGGGSFDVRDEPGGGKSIRFVVGTEARPVPPPVHRAVGYHPGSPSGPTAATTGGPIGTRSSLSSVTSGGGGPMDQASQILGHP
ncbi:hypothetical protein VTJ04DRAFT_4315 [Mycothermus thermophilus]|uniref:uncharacterized protein n=1 Tax=Humicola insolens TaxID=85995 RepID=UPI003742579F